MASGQVPRAVVTGELAGVQGASLLGLGGRSHFLPPTPYPLPGVAHAGATGAHGRSPGARSEQGPCLVAFGLDHS